MHVWASAAVAEHSPSPPVDCDGVVEDRVEEPSMGFCSRRMPPFFCEEGGRAGTTWALRAAEAASIRSAPLTCPPFKGIFDLLHCLAPRAAVRKEGSDKYRRGFSVVFVVASSALYIENKSWLLRGHRGITGEKTRRRCNGMPWQLVSGCNGALARREQRMLV